jgi:hypothetical protein
MKLLSLRLFVVLGLSGVLLAYAGCTAANAPASLTTSTIAGTVSFSGTAESSGFRTASIDPSNYLIWLQNRATKKVYFIELDSSGNFSLPVGTSAATNGNNFFAAIIQKNPLKYMGPIKIGSTTTGITVSGNIASLPIAFDLTNKNGVIPTTSVANVGGKNSFKVRLSAGKPVGMGNFGKGTGSKNTSPNSGNILDKDEDGIPDMFDAMNDGDKLDNAVPGAGADMVAHSDRMTAATMFMNLKINKSDAGSFTVANDAVLVFEMQSSVPSKITSIEAFLLNTNYQDSTILPIANGFTPIDTYPSTGTTWTSTGYKLYKATNLGSQTVWTTFLKVGNNTFQPGDLALMKVTYNDGTPAEYFWLSLNFKFTTILNDTTSWSSGSGTTVSPYVISDTGGLTLTYQPPKDESNNDLTGLEYSFEIFRYNSSHVAIGTRDVVTIGTDILTGTLTEAQINGTGATPTYIQIDITARYPYGDNAATKVFVKRSSW